MLALLFVISAIRDIPLKQPFLGLNCKRTDIYLQLAGNEIGDLIDDAYIVHAHDADTRKEGYLLVLGPFGLDDPVPVVRQ